MVSIQKTPALFHFTFHQRAKMINYFVLEPLYHYPAVIEILDDKVNMLVVQTEHARGIPKSIRYWTHFYWL